MDFLTQLSMNESWTENEKTVVSRILKNPESILTTSVKSLAAASYVSPSTIYRMLAKLGLESFSALQNEIARSLLHRETSTVSIDKNDPFSQMQTHHEIVTQLHTDYTETLATQKNLFDPASLYQAARAMRLAASLDLYTSAGNLGFFKNFQFQLREIGMNVHMAENDFEQLLMASSSDSRHLAIVLTMEGRGMLIPSLAKALERSGTPVLLISSPTCNNEFKNVKSHLLVNYRKISSFSTRLSILYILDVLYAIYFQSDYDRNLHTKFLYYHRLNPAADD